MKVPLLFIVLSVLSFTASCVRSPMLADAGDAVAHPTATDAVMGFVEMPPLYVDSSANYARKIKQASVEATQRCTHQSSCPVVRVLRADSYQRADGTTWTVVRLNACGEQRVYEERRDGWNDATARLR